MINNNAQGRTMKGHPCISTIVSVMLVAVLCAGCVTQPGQAGSSSHSPTSSPSAGAGTIPGVAAVAAHVTYPIIDTGQSACYDSHRESACPQQGQAFFGQDAQYSGIQPSYTLSSDGLTVYDDNTGLTWQRSPDTNSDSTLTKSDKLTWEQAQAYPATLNAEKFGGYSDWRLPTIRELYSLINFDGIDPSGYSGTDTSGLTPFIDTNYFRFAYGQNSAGERIIDSQYASSTKYVSTTMNGQQTLFGVNFADGRIKGYGLSMPGGPEKTFFIICVRGNPEYGINKFVDNGDGTLSDNATDLMWSQLDSGTGMDWQDALAWVQQKNAENYLGHNDWRLPNAKELQSIVDYSRSPDTTNSAAISPLFNCTQITNEAGQADYPYYWTGTTHANWNGMGGEAVYIAFGRAMGYMGGRWQDVHGAGAQRSDPKTGSESDYPQGHGPQGDAIRIDNYVRLVRGGDVTATPGQSTAVSSQGMMGTSTSKSQGTSSEQQSSGSPVTGQVKQGGQTSPGGSPPQVAIDACSSSAQGAACQFSAPRGSVNGTCRQIQQQLACVPVNRADGGGY
jgi:Protein of unknown function (DUF1566)